MDYFKEKLPQIKYFLRNHHNTKVRMILVCVMKSVEDYKDKAYFHSKLILKRQKLKLF